MISRLCLLFLGCVLLAGCTDDKTTPPQGSPDPKMKPGSPEAPPPLPPPPPNK